MEKNKVCSAFDYQGSKIHLRSVVEVFVHEKTVLMKIKFHQTLSQNFPNVDCITQYSFEFR